MAKCNWIISFREADLNEKGIDDIEFLFSSSNEITIVLERLHQEVKYQELCYL